MDIIIRIRNRSRLYLVYKSTLKLPFYKYFAKMDSYQNLIQKAVNIKRTEKNTNHKYISITVTGDRNHRKTNNY